MVLFYLLRITPKTLNTFKFQLEPFRWNGSNCKGGYILRDDFDYSFWLYYQDEITKLNYSYKLRNLANFFYGFSPLVIYFLTEHIFQGVGIMISFSVLFSSFLIWVVKKLINYDEYTFGKQNGFLYSLLLNAFFLAFIYISNLYKWSF